MWTIGELAERAAHALRRSSPVPSGRVRQVPNERLIRWYTTIGLLDPPLTRRGRVALYGRRHLMQLVAVKRRQAAGRSIAQIQAELAGATDATLADIARLPPAPTAGTDGTGRFWARDAAAGRLAAAPGHPAAGDAGRSPAAGAPAETAGPATGMPPPPVPAASGSLPPRPAATPAGSAPPVPPGVPHPSRPGLPPHGGRARPADAAPAGFSPPAPGPPPPGLVQGLRIAPEVTLLLGAPRRPLREDDLAAITAAARPLLAVLRELGLTGTAEGSPR